MFFSVSLISLLDRSGCNIQIYDLAKYLPSKVEKKEQICLSPMTKALIPTKNPKMQSNNTKTPPQFRLQNDCGTMNM